MTMGDMSERPGSIASPARRTGIRADHSLHGERGREAPDRRPVRRHVVTCFLTRRGRVLILKRSRRVGTFRGRWAAVSGYLEPGEMPLQRAFREICEETGLLEESLRLVRGGGRIPVPAGGGRRGRGAVLFIVHPFLFEVRGGRIRLDWEHTALRWVRPGELRRFRTVPALAEALESVWGPPVAGRRRSRPARGARAASGARRATPPE